MKEILRSTRGKCLYRIIIEPIVILTPPSVRNLVSAERLLHAQLQVAGTLLQGVRRQGHHNISTFVTIFHSIRQNDTYKNMLRLKTVVRANRFSTTSPLLKSEIRNDALKRYA